MKNSFKLLIILMFAAPYTIMHASGAQTPAAKLESMCVTDLLAYIELREQLENRSKIPAKTSAEISKRTDREKNMQSRLDSSHKLATLLIALNNISEKPTTQVPNTIMHASSSEELKNSAFEQLLACDIESKLDQRNLKIHMNVNNKTIDRELLKLEYFNGIEENWNKTWCLCSCLWPWRQTQKNIKEKINFYTDINLKLAQTEQIINANSKEALSLTTSQEIKLTEALLENLKQNNLSLLPRSRSNSY